MNSNEDIYKGNNAADYQPPTGNPQSLNSQTLQQGATGVQPTGSGEGALSQGTLNQTNDLKVMIIQDGSPNSSLTPVQVATQTWVGPFWGCAVLFMIGLIIWTVRMLAKEETPQIVETLEEAIHEPLIEDSVAATTVTAKPVVTKKAAGKKSTKKSSKRNKKARK